MATLLVPNASANANAGGGGRGGAGGPLPALAEENNGIPERSPSRLSRFWASSNGPLGPNGNGGNGGGNGGNSGRGSWEDGSNSGGHSGSNSLSVPQRPRIASRRGSSFTPSHRNSVVSQMSLGARGGPRRSMLSGMSVDTEPVYNPPPQASSMASRLFEHFGRHGTRFLPDTHDTTPLGASASLSGSVAGVAGQGGPNGPLGKEQAVQVGAAVITSYILIAALSVYVIIFALVDAYATAVIWAAGAVTMAVSVSVFYWTKNYFIFTSTTQLVLDVTFFLGTIIGDPILCVCMTPAVMFTTMFSVRFGEWFTSLHLIGLGVAYALIANEIVDSDDLGLVGNEYYAFLIFTVVFQLLLSAISVRFIYYQVAVQKENLEKINYHLKMQNRTLQSELRELRNLQTEEVLGSPAEKVIHMLRGLLADHKTGLSEVQRSDLHHIIRLIGSNKLYVSNVSYSAIKPSENVDTETQKWVLDQLVQNAGEQDNTRKSASLVVSNMDNEESGVQDPTSPGGKNTRLSADGYKGSGKRPSSVVDLQRASFFKTSPEKLSDRLMEILDTLDQWNFDIFEFDKLAEGHALYFLGHHLLHKHEFIQEYSIPEETMRNFLTAIESGYINNPYHNAVHAGDVLQSYNSLICAGGLGQFVEPYEVFSCLLATIIHDYKHPGVNNNFLMSVDDPIAISFNDISVLENYHVSEAFKLMAQDEYNILKNIPKDMRKKIRKLTIELVLSTDMSRHADIMSALKNSISVGDLNGESYDSRLLMMKMAMKLSDVSNPAKAPIVAQEWTRRVTQEFYCQGDKEKDKGMPISPFMDRTSPMTSKAQIGFISFVVQPLAELWNSAMGTGLDCLQNLVANLDYWKTRVSHLDHAEIF
eukprot:TRINITY_DN1908_c0_g1_i4.p1 TRINITY_DN1908_c0_g1~~TRINITY_DN1908_c0_g1_i4.p1  ORF type:complete len:871 (+),score=139.30 TRINITY_DN1908_c0_g1_i4:274-2886(+)